MDDVEWNPFSGDETAKADFLDWMSAPYIDDMMNA
jgi:hypothetical protein